MKTEKFYVKCVYRIIFLKLKEKDTQELKKKIEYVNFVISFHFKYFIDKSIGLDNRLCLYKSSPTTRWNHLNTIYIRHRSIYPSCIHAIHLNY